ncbi:MAG: hypothetical protein NTV58_06340 [Deltaproteobacteria bacterium]|nr:hypothetical protein [Deltaproteobacteria bacterium]
MNQVERTREGIEQHGKLFRGRKELLKHMDGERLTMKEAIIAKCYDCMGHYYDPGKDCKIQHCPLYSFMVYREEGKGTFKAKSNTPFHDVAQSAALTTATNPLRGESTPTDEVISTLNAPFVMGAEGRA